VIYIAIKVQCGYAKCLADVWDSNGARHISRVFFFHKECIKLKDK
jgi:hypothetical protein